MGRILFFLLVALAAYLAFRWYFSQRGRVSQDPRKDKALSESMIRCHACGLNVPRSEALSAAGDTLWFCSEKHRREHGGGD